MIIHNLIYTLDSYKQLHDVMYPEGTEYVYSYFEARKGSEYEHTIFFGLQYILKHWLEGVVITKEMIDEAEPLLKEHFKFCGNVWNRAKWDYIVENHEGRLPVMINAVEEGSKISINNVLMTIVNTDKNCFWLTNALETLLQHVWYTSTVATRSNRIIEFIKKEFKKTVDNDQQWLAEFFLHDFGQRGVSCMEQAGIGGMAHLINSKGTDTDMAIPYAIQYYKAKMDGLCYSVPASEHSIATALGKEGEFEITKRLCKMFPKGILSVVSDSYDIENAIKIYCTDLKNDILARDGKFVVRPDSPRFNGDTPANQIVWIANELGKGFGFTQNSKGYKVLNPKVGIIYGDGLKEKEIFDAVRGLIQAGWAASNCVFGQGGGLLQKLDRDTCRFAFKSSAQCRDGTWHDIYKEPTDKSKASKKGKLKLVLQVGSHGSAPVTVGYSDPRKDLLETVFLNGEITKEIDFDTVRKNAQMKTLAEAYATSGN
jgi:nicotinamide phosphoribosyltransferase